MIDSGDKLKLDQNHVETVIPAPGESSEPFNPSNLWKTLCRLLNIKLIKDLRRKTSCTSAVFFYPPQHLVVKLPAGKRVLILNGPHRDTEALLEGIDEKNFCATLTLDSVSSSKWLCICQKLCLSHVTHWFIIYCTAVEYQIRFLAGFQLPVKTVYQDPSNNAYFLI